MAGNIPVNYNPSDPSANAMQMGGMFNNNNNNNQFFVNYPPAPPTGPEMGSSSASASASTFAAIKRRQHYRRFLRRSIVRPPFYQPIPQPTPIRPPTPPPIPRQIDQSTVRFLFEKTLRKSDVSTVGRIVIPKIETELYLPRLDSREGIIMNFTDMDYQQVWSFRFRFWINNSSRMYLFENTKDFIGDKHLVVGDSIMIFKDDQTGNHFIRGIKTFIQQDLSYTANNTVNQYLPAMDEYVSPLYYENTIINNENTFPNNYAEPFYAGVQPEMPDNPELETPFNWLDFIDFSEF
ncbi:B3 domain-containing transcription factor FUS3-like [Quercus lobata]|uniref:TF-B3 domain-containing protein n=1 Tax=Quercus lobata TaxID=97700 RepID=A0A7N2L8P3_QUELO|nr:B3 domain-containing transcription factor FUS3-like [Quercus lobata]